MSVEVTFEQDGGSGLVATGISVWEAARRLGVKVRADCQGRGECDSCAVVIARGAALLSPATAAEEQILGSDRLARGERLACQTRVETMGELSIRIVPSAAEASEKEGSRKRFGDLPFKQKVGAAIELQAVTITEALNTFRGSYVGFVERFLNLKPATAKAAQGVDENDKETAAAPDQKDDNVNR